MRVYIYVCKCACCSRFFFNFLLLFIGLFIRLYVLISSRYIDNFHKHAATGFLSKFHLNNNNKTLFLITNSKFPQQQSTDRTIKLCVREREKSMRSFCLFHSGDYLSICLLNVLLGTLSIHIHLIVVFSFLLFISSSSFSFLLLVLLRRPLLFLFLLLSLHFFPPLRLFLPLTINNGCFFFVYSALRHFSSFFFFVFFAKYFILFASFTAPPVHHHLSYYKYKRTCTKKSVCVRVYVCIHVYIQK